LLTHTSVFEFFQSFFKVVSLYWPASARVLRRDPGIYSAIVFSLTCSCWRPRQRVILLQVVFIFWRVLEAVSLYWLVSAPGLGTHFFTGSSLYWLVSARGSPKGPRDLFRDSLSLLVSIFIRDFFWWRSFLRGLFFSFSTFGIAPKVEQKL